MQASKNQNDTSVKLKFLGLIIINFLERTPKTTNKTPPAFEKVNGSLKNKTPIKKLMIGYDAATGTIIDAGPFLSP